MSHSLTGNKDGVTPNPLMFTTGTVKLIRIKRWKYVKLSFFVRDCVRGLTSLNECKVILYLS